MDPTTSAVQELLKLGVPGVVIIGLVTTIVVLYRRINELQKEKDDIRKEKDATIAALQESRLQAAEKCTVALTTATAAIQSQVETNQDLMESFRTIAQEYQARRGRS